MRLSIDLEFDNFNQLLDFIHILSKTQIRVIDPNNFASLVVMDSRRVGSGENGRGRGGRYSERNNPISSTDLLTDFPNGHAHPTQRDTFKLKKFFQIFKSLTDKNREVDRTQLLEQLVEGKFTIEEARQFIERGIENGQITIKEYGRLTITDI